MGDSGAPQRSAATKIQSPLVDGIPISQNNGINSAPGSRPDLEVRQLQQLLADLVNERAQA